MVAISLYRGNLHRVPDAPRRWPMPQHRLSLRHFKLLLQKRSLALSRLSSSSAAAAAANNPPLPDDESTGDNHSSKLPQPLSVFVPNSPQIDGAAIDHKPRDDSSSKSKGPDAPPSFPDEKPPTPAPTSAPDPVPESEPKTTTDVAVRWDIVNEKENRKKELEKNLQVLNEKKHRLVQALRQILNAEEEIKKRNSIQISGIRVAVPLQMEATIDSGSVTRHVIPKIGSDGNISGDLEGESEDMSYHNAHTRHFHQMHNTSPSAASSLRKPGHSPFQHNTTPLTNRASFTATGYSQAQPNAMMGILASPSRFGPSGHQSHSGTQPHVSVSGSPFVASSPSPAASGGTSVFRDSRLTSPPWN